MRTHIITLIIEDGTERCYVETEDNAWYFFEVALKMGYYATITPVAVYQ